MSKPNWTVKDENGKEHWISRSIVVVPMTFKWENNKLYTLIEQRGPAVSNTGEWCCPCGYIDWDETLEEACIREVREETGVVIPEENITFINVNGKDKKPGGKQNVTLRYICFVNEGTQINLNAIETKDEIQQVQWLEIGDYNKPSEFHLPTVSTITVYKDKIVPPGNGKFCFGHEKIIIELLEKFYKNIGQRIIVK